MNSLAALLVATAMIAQFQGGALDGAVIDTAGKAVGDAQVLFVAPAPWGGKVQPVEVRTKTDASGRFRLIVPPLTGLYILRSRVWIYRSDLGITAAPVGGLNSVLVLRKAAATTIKLEGPEGGPIARASISPRVISIARGSVAADIPETLAAPLAVTTGPLGTATLSGLSDGHRLMAVRITSEATGTQDIPIGAQRRDASPRATVTIRLAASSRLSGRVTTQSGQGVRNQVVEIWRQGSQWLEPSPIVFKNGPLLSAADGSFQTPDNLLVGSTYRVVIRTPGMEPILADWITVGEKPRYLPQLVQRPLLTISGRVIDRHGKAVAGIEVFQAGDGPERTSTKTDAHGRFELGGFRQGPVFLFANGEGFRFHGQLVKPGDGEITIPMTHTSELPAHPMRMLPDAIPLEASRVLARRLLEPYWADFDKKSDAEKARALYSLAAADPVGVMGKIDAVKFPNARLQSLTLRAVVLALIDSDPELAALAAERVLDPAMRASSLLTIVDALPAQERERKLSLMERAAALAKDSNALPFSAYLIGDLAERWHAIGEREKAETLFAEGLRAAKEAINKTSPWRGDFAARLARVDLRAALAIAKDYPVAGPDSQASVRQNIAFHLAGDNPTEAENVLREIPRETGRERMPGVVAWKMAAADPERARGLVDLSQRDFDHPQAYLYLALGLRDRDLPAAREAFAVAMRGIDRLLRDGGEYSYMLASRHVLLPIVEQIDPALVPEYFWRVVASRPSFGNPMAGGSLPASQLALLLAWYDWEVAAVLFQPIRNQMENTHETELIRESTAFLSWSMFDPKSAAERLLKLPVDARLDLNADHVRRQVCEYLRLSHEARWRKVWGNFTEMAGMIYPD
jgi:hypothetical protein